MPGSHSILHWIGRISVLPGICGSAILSWCGYVNVSPVNLGITYYSANVLPRSSWYTRQEVSLVPGSVYERAD